MASHLLRKEAGEYANYCPFAFVISVPDGGPPFIEDDSTPAEILCRAPKGFYPVPHGVVRKTEELSSCDILDRFHSNRLCAISCIPSNSARLDENFT